MDYEDGLLPDNDEVRFAVCDIIRKVKPDIIVTHHENSMHKDHIVCHRIVVDAWFYAAIEGFQRELPKHFAKKLYFAENWEEAIDHHWFAVHSTSFPYKEYYSHLKRLRGIQGRKGYCECFMIPKEQYKLVQTLENL